MALINCIECGKKISNSAEQCPNCGFPQKEYVRYVNNKKMQAQRLEEEKQKQIKIEQDRIAEENRRKNIRCKECNEIIGEVDICPNCGYNMKKYNMQVQRLEQTTEAIRQQLAERQRTQVTSHNIPKCPTCGSTRIQKISMSKKAVGAIGFGLLSKTAKSQFECKNCGYKW